MLSRLNLVINFDLDLFSNDFKFFFENYSTPTIFSTEVKLDKKIPGYLISVMFMNVVYVT